MTRLTRRAFIGKSLLLGGTLSVFPACGSARRPASAEKDRLPAYARLARKGGLAERIARATDHFKHCRLCPRHCGVNRQEGERGYCRAPRDPVVASHQPHFGEELPLTGRRGSGTLFFSNCNLRCVFCQNWPIAHEGRGRQVTAADLADQMLSLQERGCHNINAVTPTHVMPNILEALSLAVPRGLHIPLVYNTGGYESADVIELLQGIVDVYMPDLKFMDTEPAGLYLDAPDYPEKAQASIREMYRQVGPLAVDARGIATGGLMIRHLVMPNRLSNARAFVQWVSNTLSPDVYVNIMAQYRVDYRAYEHPGIARAIHAEEFIEAMDWAEEAGLANLDARSVSHHERLKRRQR